MRTELLLTLAALPGLAAESGFESASAKVWRLYESEADKHDTELAETWRGQTDAMLIFVRTLYRLGHEGGHPSKSLTLLPIDGLVLCRRCGVHHRDIQNAPS